MMSPFIFKTIVLIKIIIQLYYNLVNSFSAQKNPYAENFSIGIFGYSYSAAQVSFAHFDVIGQLIGGAFHLHGAGFQHVGAVGNLQGHLGILLHH